MHAVKTFGRRPVHASRPRALGEAPPSAETPVTAVPSCAFSSYLGDAPEPDSMTHGTKTALIGVGLVGVGWLLGGIVPVVGRAIGSLAGAAVAGGVAYAGYSSWQTSGGTTHQPGACGAK